jgi:hypothetical protein
LSPDDRTKRPGSRLLLAFALAGGALAALYGGARVADLIADALGIASIPVRLVLKVLLMAATLPVAFYLVERFFLERSARRK